MYKPARGAPAWDRAARTVQRARLRIPPNAGPHRFAALMEEALRLASLPGENEGRVYYFRRLHIRGLPASGDRGSWLDRFQRALLEQAAEAVHAGDPRSRFAAAVYFRSETELLEIFLARLARQQSSDIAVEHEWFWPEPLVQSDLPTVIETLRQSPASWSAVAAVVFQLQVAAPRPIEPNRLIESIPASRADAWVRELDGAGPEPPPDAVRQSLALPAAVREAVVRAAQWFGPGDPRVLWLTALAVLRACPADLSNRTSISRARAVLRDLADGSVTVAGDPSTGGVAAARVAGAPRVSASLPEIESGQAQSIFNAHTAGVPVVHSAALPIDAPVVSSRPECEETNPILSGPSSPPFPPSRATPAAAPTPAAEACTFLGVPTAIGGLLFLLNAFTWLGLPDELAGELGWACPDFAARLLLHLAIQAEAPEHDPVLNWVRSLISAPTLPEPIHRRLRIWAVRTRKWCWHAGHITAREVVNRDGIFSAGRIDIDISLPLDTADVRIRLLGLDLDPGWLPWFGRVVRFHYPRRRDW
jgi:hypothetical protein